MTACPQAIANQMAEIKVVGGRPPKENRYVNAVSFRERPDIQVVNNTLPAPRVIVSSLSIATFVMVVPGGQVFNSPCSPGSGKKLNRGSWVFFWYCTSVSCPTPGTFAAAYTHLARTKKGSTKGNWWALRLYSSTPLVVFLCRYVSKHFTLA